MTGHKYYKDLIESLKDPAEAVGYLRVALEETDMPEVFLLALKNVAEARDGATAEVARLDGNVNLRSLWVVLDALGLKLSVDCKEAL